MLRYSRKGAGRDRMQLWSVCYLQLVFAWTTALTRPESRIWLILPLKFSYSWTTRAVLTVEYQAKRLRRSIKTIWKAMTDCERSFLIHRSSLSIWPYFILNLRNNRTLRYPKKWTSRNKLCLWSAWYFQSTIYSARLGGRYIVKKMTWQVSTIVRDVPYSRMLEFSQTKYKNVWVERACSSYYTQFREVRCCVHSVDSKDVVQVHRGAVCTCR